MKHLYILTGASRGMGLGIALQLRERAGAELLCLSRNANPALEAPHVTQWPLDLARPVEAADRLEAWLQERAGRWDAATLINNAALLTPPGGIEAVEAAALSQALRVGLEAPVLLCAAFLRATHGIALRKILNISSGLGRRALAGSAPYCAVKGGLDHFTRALALDEAQRPDGARVVSLAPGIIDTDMQVQLRSADPARFAAQPMFAAYHDEGGLATPRDAASAVLAYLDRADFGRHPVADVRDPA